MFSNRNRQNRVGLGVLLLGYQLLFSNDYIPPVTLAVILAQVAIFMGFIPALDFHHVEQLCLNPHQVWKRGQWHRMLFATFIHADDMHLYYNMISFLWKGRRLERKFGQTYFAYIVAIFSLLTALVHVGLSVFIEDFVDFHEFNLMRSCAVGFSGVIFALKVLSNEYFPSSDQWLFGLIPVPSQFACWAELLMIQLLVPRASFVGHLAGILVGLAYVKGPLKMIMDLFIEDPSARYGSRSNTSHEYSSSMPRGRFWGSGRLGGNAAPPQYGWNVPADEPMHHDRQQYHDGQYHDYTAGLSEEEQLRRAMDESMRTNHNRAHPFASAPPLYPDLDQN